MSHKTELEAIRKLTRSLGGTCNVLSQGHKLHGSAGIPDLYLQFPRHGLAVWCEVKVGRDRMSEAQREFCNRQEDCQGEVLVGGVENVIVWLNDWGVEVKG